MTDADIRDIAVNLHNKCGRIFNDNCPNPDERMVVLIEQTIRSAIREALRDEVGRR